jgi:hypothetical protein
MRTSIKIALLAILLISKINCKAQQDSLKFKIIDFMIEKGELDKTNNKNDYIDNVFIVNLIKQEKECNAKNYLYKIGVHASHSLYYLMLKNGNKYEFMDVKKLDEVLMHIIGVSRESNRSSEETLKNVEAVIALYQRNLKVIPWTN